MSRYLIPTNNVSTAAIANAIDYGVTYSNFYYSDLDANMFPHQYPTTAIFASVWRSDYIFFFGVSTHNATWGTVGMTYPWTQTTTTSFITLWINSGSYTYLTLTATPAYGRVFDRWDDGVSGILSTSNPWTIAYTDAVASSYLNLRAIFK